jgi:hypothetical protein
METPKALTAYDLTSAGPRSPDLLDLSDPKIRKAVSPTARATFRNIVSAWKLVEADARALLGGVTATSYREHFLKRGASDEARVLTQDELTRISLLLGIYTALHVVYDDTIADAWMQLPNTNRLFRGRTPLEFVTHGGILNMTALRQFLDAQAVGAF